MFAKGSLKPMGRGKHVYPFRLPIRRIRLNIIPPPKSSLKRHSAPQNPFTLFQAAFGTD